jgi:hypothetical protein
VPKEIIQNIPSIKTFTLRDIYLAKRSDSRWQTPLELYLDNLGVKDVLTVDYIKDLLNCKIAEILGLQPGFLARMINLNHKAPAKIKEVKITATRDRFRNVKIQATITTDLNIDHILDIDASQMNVVEIQKDKEEA